MEEETAYNPWTCESMVTRTEKAKTNLGSSPLQVHQATSSVTQFSSAHIKTIWRDPATINITSMVSDLSWPLYGAGGPIKGKTYSYEFPWDKWTNSGIRGPFLTASEGLYPNEITEPKGSELGADWYVSTHETFYNSDFAKLLDKLLIGEIACGEKTVQTQFYHDIKTFGYSSGAVGYWWEDTKKGDCSNLVHHVSYYGRGWEGPEKEYTSFSYPAIIASREYEGEAEAAVAGSSHAPAVNTVQATELESAQVTLNGEINPEGYQTHYFFEYGPSEAYGLSTNVSNAGSGSSPVFASARVNLESATTYHYRLVATNSAGTTYGPDQVFTSPPMRTCVTIHTRTGELLVFAENASHELIVFSPASEGSWTVFNVSAVVAGRPTIANAPAVVEPSPGEFLVFAEDAANHDLISFARSSAGAWSVFNETEVVAGQPTIAGTPAVVEPSPGEFLVYLEDTNHELISFARTSLGAWTVLNITAVTSGNPDIL